MKKLLFLFLPFFCFSQQIKTCNLPEGEALNLSKTILGSGELQTKKTKLGYVVKSEDATMLYTLASNNYNFYQIEGPNEFVKSIWKTYFNPGYSENATNYENTIQKKNGSDIRLQKSQDHYFIKLYSCAN